MLVSFSDSSALTPGQPQRVTLGIADAEGVVISGPPSTIDFTVTFNGQAIGPSIRATSHSEGLPRPYYPLQFTPAQPGVYTFRTTVDGAPLEASIQIPASTPVIAPGAAMVPVDTPITTDRRGVELLCTRNAECSLHDVTLREALTLGTPVALLVGTPLYCQTAICGPVLDVLLAQQRNSLRSRCCTPRYIHRKRTHSRAGRR